MDADYGGGTGEVSDTGEARAAAAAAAATASAQGAAAAAAPGDPVAVPPLDERTKRVARSLAGVTAAASDALASAPATSGAVPVQSAALYAFFLSLASALVGRCRLTVSKPELKARLVSALETKIS